MSKNFELLKQLEGGEWRIPTAADNAEDVAASATNFGTRLKGRTYDELCRLVHRLFPPGGDIPGCVLFTGVEPSVGCTWVAANTAKVLCSRSPARACLVCMDASHEHLREYFEFSGAEGAEQSDSDNPRPRRVASNLWVLTTGKKNANIPSLSRAVESLVIDMRHKFDYVLLDAPPVTRNSFVCSIGSMVDGTVLILKASRTRRSVVQLAMERLESAGVTLLGTVLNQREYPIPHSIYKRL